MSELRERCAISWGAARGYSYPSRRRHRWVKWSPVVLLVLAAAYVGAQLARPVPDLRVHAQLAAARTVPGTAPQWPWPKDGQAVLAVDGVGTVGSSGGDRPVPIASVAKVMTAYVVLADHPLGAHDDGPVITMTQADEDAAASAGEQSVLAVQAGEKLTLRQAMQALLVVSANNIAKALARFDAGSVPAFLAKMNATAKKLGMTHTTYTDPSGLAATTVSTAQDQLVLARKAFAVQTIRETVAMPQVRLPGHGVLYNWNYLVGHDGVVGIKTGSSAAAGGCLMFAARKPVAGKDRTVLGVVLGQHGTPVLPSALHASQRLIDAVPGNLRQVTVLPAGTRVARVTAPDNPPIAVATTEPVQVVGWPGMPVDLHVTLPRRPSRERVSVQVAVRAGDQAQDVAAEPTRPIGTPSVGWRLQRLPWS